MKILVTVASRHGATKEIAEAIARELAERGLEVTVSPVQEVDSIQGYDAVVLGSAVYLGKWMKPAKAFAAREAAGLSSVPVWLFSSGPIGDVRTTPPIDGKATRSPRRSGRATTTCSAGSSTGRL
jgi:menaquinone-dependent protoporphyrinogen oxidase